MSEVTTTVLEPEQFAPEIVAEAKLQARTLMTKNVYVSGAAQSMLVLRRAYGVAHLALQRAVEGGKGNEACATAIAEAMQEQASQTFDLGELIKQMTQLVLPLLMSEQQLLDELDSQDDKKALQAAEKVRAEMPILLPGLRDQQVYQRKRSTVYRGHARALELVRNAMQLEQPTGITVLHLYGGAYQNQTVTNQRGKPYVRVGIQQWRNQAKTQGKLNQFLGSWLRFANGVKFDLVVIDDLTQLQAPIIAGADNIRSIAPAHKMLRKWCDLAGSALIGFVPGEERLPVDKPEETSVWSSLREHADVVPVNVLTALGTEIDTHYRLQVGDEGETIVIEQHLIQGANSG